MQHPFSKMNSVKSILSEDIFKRCGKQEDITIEGIPPGAVKELDEEIFFQLAGLND